MSLDRCCLNTRVDKAAPLSTLRRPAGSVGWKTSAACSTNVPFPGA